MMDVAFFDTKRYDRDFMLQADGADAIAWHFREARLNTELASTAQGSRAVVVFVQDVVDRPCLERLKELDVEMVALRCAGFNNVDLDAAKELGIVVTRVPAYSPHAVAEHTVGLLLTLNRKIHRAYNRVREQNFALAGLVGFDIAGKTVGVIGTGKIGRIVAQIFQGFDAKVIAYDPFPQEAWAKERGIEYASLDELLPQADIVSLHAPLTPETKHIIDEAAVAKMKQGAYIVNTSRGKLIDTPAIVAALKTGKLGGVALDVYEEEEGVFFEDHSDHALQDDQLARLITFPNVLITSHQAFLTNEALGEIARVTVTNLLALKEGRPFLDGTVVGETGRS